MSIALNRRVMSPIVDIIEKVRKCRSKRVSKGERGATSIASLSDHPPYRDHGFGTSRCGAALNAFLSRTITQRSFSSLDRTPRVLDGQRHRGLVGSA